MNILKKGKAPLPAEYYIRDWSMLGPFSFRDTEYAKAQIDPGILEKSFVGNECELVPDNPKQGWQAVERESSWASEWLPIDRLLAKPGEHIRDAWQRYECSVAYVGAIIESDTPIPDAVLRFAAGGYYKVWWNGAELYHYGDEGVKLHGAELDRQPAGVRAGKNYLVVKSCNFRGAWNLCAQLATSDGQPFRVHSPQAAAFDGKGLCIAIVDRKPVHRVVAIRGAPRLFIGPSGEIVAYEDMDEEVRRMVSFNNGQSFQRCAHFPKNDGVKLADGTVYHIDGVGSGKGDRFLATVYRFDPADKILRGPLQVPVYVPGARRWSYSDQGRPSGAGFGFHCVIRAKDDRLLAATHCYWEGDTDLDEVAVGSQQFSAGFGMTKPRLILLESLDQGESWHIFSTIARHPELGQEGWFEPALAELPSGDLLVVMRNGSKYLPLWQSRSSDGGRSWDEPGRLPMLGVHPQLRVLSNGVLALASVRPHIMLSLDPTGTGRDWSHHVMVAPANNGGLGGIVFMEELKPNTVLFPVYEEFPVDPPVRGRTKDMHLAVVKIRVERPESK